MTIKEIILEIFGKTPSLKKVMLYLLTWIKSCMDFQICVQWAPVWPSAIIPNYNH